MAKTLQAVVADIERTLAPTLAAEARAAARALVCDHLGLTFTALALRYADAVGEGVEAELLALARRVACGEPLQYVTGVCHFSGLDIRVAPGVLIPRPETEELVERVVGWAGGRRGLRALDVGTGSGCIALSLRSALTDPRVVAVDASADALRIAGGNAEALGLDVDFRQADILAANVEDLLAGQGPYDAVVSNPPYVRLSEAEAMSSVVLDHEPRMALFVADDDPLVFYRRIGRLCRDGLLSPSGRVFFEINEALGAETGIMLRGLGFGSVSVAKDFTGRDRFVEAALHSEH